MTDVFDIIRAKLQENDQILKEVSEIAKEVVKLDLRMDMLEARFKENIAKLEQLEKEIENDLH